MPLSSITRNISPSRIRILPAVLGIAGAALALAAPVAATAQAAAPVLASASPATPVAASATASRPATPTKPSLLIYRAAPSPLGKRDTVSALVYGDHSGAALHLRLIASSGAAASASAAIRGSDADTEPLWPQWISPPITLDFKGWKKIAIPVASFTYRAPVGETAAEAPKQSMVDAMGVDLSDSGETVLLDNLIWSSTQAGVDAVTVDDFETGNFAAWQAHGTPECVADGQLALVTDTAKLIAGRVAFKVSFAEAKHERAEAKELVAKTLAAVHASYLTFVPASPFHRVLPTTLPQDGETAQALQLFACPDQTEYGSFCIYSDSGLTDVSVKPVFDLQETGRTIDKSNIDIEVVKIWERQGGGKWRDPDAAGPTPELLVKDDREPLQALAGVPPAPRLTGDPATTIPAHTTKQFWVTVHVPKDARAGHYSTQLAISAPGAPQQSVTLQLEVLPLRLYSASKQYVMGLQAKMDGSGIDKDTFCAELADIRAHGFLYATLTDAPAGLPDALAAYKAASFGSTLMYAGLTGTTATDMAAADQIDGQRRTLGVDSIAYIAPDRCSLDELAAMHKAHRTTAKLIRSSDEFDAAKDVVDMPIYSVDETYVQSLLRTGGLRTSDKYDYWFWPAYENDLQADRLYAGYLLYRANLYGAFLPAYQTPAASDPFVDAPTDGASGEAARLRPQMLTYPAKGGVIDTLQWDAVASGVNDIRYLTTYFAALRECKDNHVASDLVRATEPQVKAMMNKAFWVMDDTEYQKARRIVAHDTVLLRKALDKFYQHGGGDPLNANATMSVKPAKAVKVKASSAT